MKNFKKLLSALIAFMAIVMLNPTGASAYWKQDSNNHWNYVSNDGYNLTGWHQIDGKWYYFNDNEVMQTGWVNSNGNWYYLYGDGTMAHDTTIEGYYLNSAGAWSTNVPAVTTNTYSSGNSSHYNSGTTNNQSQTVYVSRNEI